MSKLAKTTPIGKPKKTHQEDSWNAIDKIPQHPTLEQFFGSQPLKPCQKLVLDIIKDAFYCIRGTAPISGAGALLLYHKGKMAIAAMEWLINDSEEVSSFRWCCYSLGWEYPDKVRKHILQFVNHEIIQVAQALRFSVWKNKNSRLTKKSYRCSFELKGEKIDMGSFPTQRAAERALWKKYSERIKNESRTL